MARAENTEIIDRFEEFYRNYYRNEIGALAQKYPNEQRSLYVDWTDLYRFEPDLADDYRTRPEQMQEYAEEALRLYDLPVDVKLGRAHVRVTHLGEITDIRDIRARHRGQLIEVRGIVRKATDVRPKVTEAAFECQRCGTLTRIPQTGGDFQEPHECQGCERQGPFKINFDQSEFVDAQKIRVQESPEGLRGGETPQNIDVHIEDDITGEVTAGDHVRVTGVLHLDQQGSRQEKSTVFDTYMEGMAVEIEDEQFEDMDITEADKREIVELSSDPDIYEKMVGSMAPSIYGYEQQKLAIILQLFSGVTKHLPDDSRIRGDLHMLFIGDPGTGKCLNGDEIVTLADGSEVPIRDIVEEHLDDPKPVDDGIYDEVDFKVPSLNSAGSITHRRATKVWKREAPDHMYRIVTESGHELRVTPSHPLFVQRDGQFTPIPAENLQPDEYVATPRRIPTHADDSLDVQYRQSRANGAVCRDLPRSWSPSLARLLGYLTAEGCVILRYDHTDDVRITTNEPEILADVQRTFDELGLNYTRSSTGENSPPQVVHCNPGAFASFLAELEPAILEESADQCVPDALMRASDEIKSEFLKAYVDCEGYIAADEREITVASLSRELLENVRSLLLSLGIRSQLREHHNGSYRLRINGVNFRRYVEAIGFITDRKPVDARGYTDVEGHTNTDIIPAIGDELERIRTALGLSQCDCGIPRSTYQLYERGDRNPGRERLRAVVEAFENQLDRLRDARCRITDGSRADIEEIRSELGVSQSGPGDALPGSQKVVSLNEPGEVVADGGVTRPAGDAAVRYIDRALQVSDDVRALRALTESDVGWDRIEIIEPVEADDEWVYDLEIEGTHNYISSNIISHNSQLLQYVRNLAPRSVYTSGKGSSAAGLTAAAVRDDFGDGQQWTLEAGALVLADQGIAAVDELDKMDSSDRSALHEGLEQQSISVSKAGINATLKSRCSLLGAANPKYGRFDPYEPVGEQIDLEPALISRFDLIFTVTDQPDEEEDRALAEHIIKTNYAGELNTHREEASASNISAQEVENVTDEVEPEISADLLRKYVAYAKRNCFPTMTEEAKTRIREFYVDLRVRGEDEDAPVPVTARKLEALVRLAEASARVRLSDTVEEEDAERVIEIVRSCLEDVGMDPETGEFDADVVETGTSKTQRDRIKNIKSLITEIEGDYEEGAPVDEVLDRAEEAGLERSKAEHEIEKLRRQGDVYEPTTDHLRTV